MVSSHSFKKHVFRSRILASVFRLLTHQTRHLVWSWKMISTSRRIFWDGFQRFLKNADFRGEVFRSITCSRIAGNHLKRCALMHLSFFLLNDDTMYQFRGVKRRNTEAKKVRPNIIFFKSGWKPSQKMRLDALIIFLIEWRHQVSISRGEWSKYWS